MALNINTRRQMRMAAKKKVAKPDPLKQQRSARAKAYAKLRAVERKAEVNAAGYRGQLDRLERELQQNAKTIADKNQAIANRDELMRQLNVKLGEVTAERDRILELVNKFLSVQITSPTNTSRELRKGL